MLRSVTLSGLLSFKSATLELQKLNVLIGANAAGKSNFIESLSLLQAAPRDLAKAVQKGGGMAEWKWKGKEPAGEGVHTSSHRPAAHAARLYPGARGEPGRPSVQQ